MIHRGEILATAVKETNTKISMLARHLKVSRHTIYRYYEDPMLNIDTLLEAGIYMKYDFMHLLPEFKPVINKQDKENQDYKLKYFELLEKHIKVLEEQGEILKKKKGK